MNIFKKIISLISATFILAFVILIIAKPSVCRDGAINGILMCGRVIIPSLYPFTMCVLFIMKSGILEKLQPLSPVTNALFGINAELFSVMLLSFIGGFPVGARLIDEYVKTNTISEKQGAIMLNYCINAGPAFIIGTVGLGITGSKQIGYILLISHIASSVILCIISRFWEPEIKANPKIFKTHISPADNFVLSASEAAASVFSICAFVILFSAISAYLTCFSAQFPLLRHVIYITEVTNGITHTNNILLISFLLGFGGICVWCQIISAAKNTKINFLIFVLFRVLHGTISTIFTHLLLKATHTALSVFSNNKVFYQSFIYSTPSLSISMLAMVIIFLISLNTKKYTGKILEDIV